MDTALPSESAVSARWVRTPGVVARVIRGEVLLVPIRRTSDALDGFYTLNGTAATIWELASDNRSAVEMAGVLSERYTVSEADAVEDVLRILRELEHIGALQRIA